MIDSLAELLRQAPALAGAWVADIDLRGSSLDWESLDVRGAVFAGCRLDTASETSLRRRGVVVLPPIEGLAFSPYRTELYSNAELMAGYEPGRPDLTLDARIGAATARDASPIEVLARGIHDASIDAALVRLLERLAAPVVGVMGSHSTPRDAPEYRMVAELGRRLARRGFVVATGGGPGLMEAANLGAWLAPTGDEALDEAVEILGRSPLLDTDAAGFVERALEVRSRWPDGGVSLGVPTWVYVDEPSNQFAAHIAKYFQNSIRENGLLAIALGGVIYAAGGAGTAEELFTDAAQNEYSLYGVRSPMVILDAAPLPWAGMVDSLRALAEHGGWGALVRVVDSVEAAVDALAPHAPPSPVPTRPLRKR